MVKERAGLEDCIQSKTRISEALRNPLRTDCSQPANIDFESKITVTVNPASHLVNLSYFPSFSPCEFIKNSMEIIWNKGKPRKFSFEHRRCRGTRVGVVRFATNLLWKILKKVPSAFFLATVY